MDNTLTIKEQVSNRLLQNKIDAALDSQAAHLTQLYQDSNTAQHQLDEAEQRYQKTVKEGYYWHLPIRVNTKEEGYYRKIPTVNTRKNNNE